VPAFERSPNISASGKPLHIDIPVKLKDVKTVYSIDALAFEGDLAASIFHLQLITNDIADANAKSEVIAVFHTNAGHVALHDVAYNTDRNITSGNLYKDLLADLMKRGVRVELCGATLTTGETPTCSRASRSTRMPWRGRRNSFKKDS
jgi:intracellular sulfur oxidation DsrE/DsrF family protein